MREWMEKTPIHKGWSKDRKYRVADTDGTRYLLRLSAAEQYDAKKRGFEMMQRVAALDIPICRPVAFGKCEEGVYTLQTWIDGEDAQEILPFLSDTQQYVYGLEAGRILKKIHMIPAPANQPDWESRFNAKIDRKIKMYRDCPVKFAGDENLLAYIKENRRLLSGRPQCFQHGDYHVGNMMIENGKLVIIDFDRYDFGDPWEDFNRIVWSAQASPLFASGIVNGYFDGDVPLAFWKLLCLYISSNMLSSIPWAIPFGEGEVNTMRRQAKDVLRWYDDMKNPVPTWYFKGYYLQQIDNVPYKLKAPFDFGFMRRYGRVFKVFDDQDSGNICFGTEKDGQKYFVKFACAPTEQFSGEPRDAVERLRSSVPVYRDLHHENLIEFLNAEEIGGGFAMVFRWAQGDCMGRMYPQSSARFFKADLQTKLQIYADILSFFAYIASRHYVAVDFYDGCILYDFEKRKTTICDIDFFRKAPFRNDMGRMWGSSRFQAPEEYELGAVIDEITNVYTLGATAFVLFADNDRSAGAWPLGQNTYAVVNKAVSADRKKRQQSVKQLIEAFQTALLKDL